MAIVGDRPVQNREDQILDVFREKPGLIPQYACAVRDGLLRGRVEEGAGVLQRVQGVCWRGFCRAGHLGQDACQEGIEVCKHLVRFGPFVTSRCPEPEKVTDGDRDRLLPCGAGHELAGGIEVEVEVAGVGDGEVESADEGEVERVEVEVEVERRVRSRVAGAGRARSRGGRGRGRG